MDALRQAAENGRLRFVLERGNDGSRERAGTAPAQPTHATHMRLPRHVTMPTPATDADAASIASSDRSQSSSRRHGQRRRLPSTPGTRSTPGGATTEGAPLPPGAVMLELPTNPTGLGITIVAARAGEPVRVQTIVAGGTAAQDGRLRVGDAILAVNGRSLKHVPAHEVIDRLAAARAPAGLQEETATLLLGGRAAGLTFVDDGQSGLRIAAVVPGSPAEGAGLVAGAEIVTLNRFSVRTAREAKRITMRAVSSGNDLVVTVRTGRVLLAVLPKALADARAGSPTSLFSASSGKGDALLTQSGEILDSLARTRTGFLGLWSMAVT